MLERITLFTDSDTGQTLTGSILANVEIGASQIMPSVTNGRASLLGNFPMAVTDILSMSNLNEVISPHAVFNFAEMADLKALNSLSEDETVSIGDSSTIPKMPITLGIKGANPEMAVAKLGMERRQWSVFIDVPPEPFFRWESYVDTWHTHDYTGLVMS